MERSIRNFRLLEELGTGGMGVIHRAVQTSLDRPAAVKELHPHLAKDAEFIRRFEREAKSAATLHHENIVGVFDHGQEGNRYFIAMEYVDGADLRSLLAIEPRLPLPVALSLTVDTLRGLEHAHGRGIVHRDIKPANVLVGRDGVAKIADFSIAHGAQLPQVTLTGNVFGTPGYMSPEQVEAKPVDGRSDLFAVGSILYEMLSAERPFDAESYPAVINKVLALTPPPLTTIDPLLPPAVSKAVERALQKDPSKRFASAAEFREALEEAARAAGIAIGHAPVRAFLETDKVKRALARNQATASHQRALFLMNQQPPDLAEAIRALERAVSLDPGYEEAQKLLVSARERRRPALIRARIAAAALAVLLPLAAWRAWQAIPAPSVPTPAPTAVALSTAPATATAAPTAAASSTRVAVVRTPGATPPPVPTHLLDPEHGKLKITVAPWAKVFVDDRYVDTTPMAPLALEAGRHTLRLVNPAFQDWVEIVDVPSGGLIERKVDLRQGSVLHTD